MSGSGTSPNVTNIASGIRGPGGSKTTVMVKVREQLCVALETSLKNVQRELDEASGGTDEVSADEFDRTLRKRGIFLSTQELGQVQRLCPGQTPKGFAVSAFLTQLHPPMDDYRMALVDQLWSSLSGGSGQVLVADAMTRFNAKKHPLVQSLEVTPENMVTMLEADLLGWASPAGALDRAAFDGFGTTTSPPP